LIKLILLSRLGGPDFALNPDLIERAEATPDTVVTLVGGNKYVVRQTIDELIELICLDRAQIIAAAEKLNAANADLADAPLRPHHLSHGRESVLARDSGRSSVISLRPKEN
jgi:uncharacterized protein YlzI (FlbEa/FlbD family)